MKGYFKITVAAVIWGSIGPVVRLIDLPVPLIVFFRVAFASLAILIFIATQRKIERLAVGKNIYLLSLMGVLLALSWISFFNSVKLTTIAKAVFITYTSPIFIAVLAPLFLKEKLEKNTGVTLLVSLIGIILITGPSAISFSAQELAGITWAFVSALTYTALVIIAKLLTVRVSVLAMIFYEELIGAIILSPTLLIYDFSLSQQTLLILFLLGAVQTAFAAALYLSGLRDVTAQQANIFTYLDPVSAIIFAAIILGELPRVNTVAGGILIIVSGLVVVIINRVRVSTEVVSE